MLNSMNFQIVRLVSSFWEYFSLMILPPSFLSSPFFTDTATDLLFHLFQLTQIDDEWMIWSSTRHDQWWDLSEVINGSSQSIQIQDLFDDVCRAERGGNLVERKKSFARGDGGVNVSIQ